MITIIAAGLVSLVFWPIAPSATRLCIDVWGSHRFVSATWIYSAIRLAWWGGFVVMVLYLVPVIILVLSWCRDPGHFKWIRQKTIRNEYFVLFAVRFSCHFSKLRSTLKKTRTRPSTFQLKLRWDDMLDDMVPKTKIKLSITIPTCSSPTPTITVSEDEVFKTPTLSYLGSPTTKTLSLLRFSVPQNITEIPKPRTPSPISPTFHKAAVDNPVYSPPNSPLPTLPASCYGSRSRSYSPSDLPSEDTFGHPLWLHSHLCSRSFEGLNTSSWSPTVPGACKGIGVGKLWTTNRHRRKCLCYLCIVSTLKICRHSRLWHVRQVVFQISKLLSSLFLVQILLPGTSAFWGNCNGKTAQDWAVRYSESR